MADLGFINDPYRTGAGATRKERKTLRGQGLRGAALRSGVQDWRTKTHAAGETAATADLSNLGIDPTVYSNADPLKFKRNLLGGKGPAMRRIALLQAASKRYGGAGDALQSELSSSLAAGAPVDPKLQEAPMLGALESYTMDRLGVGLTPTEEAAARAQLSAPVQAQAQSAAQAEASSEAASGIDPRSGLGRQRANQIAEQRAQGLSGVENDITNLDLQRKQQIEGLATGVAAGEEGRRQFDVGSKLSRLAQVEGGLGSLSRLREGERQYDVSYTEAQRQANKRRADAIEAAKALEPSNVEKWAGGVAGVFQGLGV